MKRLILAPHPDDESLGCGGLLAKDPHESAVAVLSDKGDGRLDELDKAHKILGYQLALVAPFATGSLTDRSRELTTWIDNQLRELKPDALYIPTPGAHQDHIAVYEAGIRSARMSYTSDAWFVPNVYLYHVPSYTTELYPSPYPWGRYLSLTEEEMDRKMQAIAAYESQAVGCFNPAKLAEEHANYTGSKVNVRYAEQYAVVRQVEGSC